MMNSVTGEPPNFLDGKPTEHDKITWKLVYATYLIQNSKTSEEFEKKPVNLTELLPVLIKLDPKWEHVEPDMMKTTHTMVHRLNIFLDRFKKQFSNVHEVMQDIRENQDGSAEVDQTNNPDRTDSEKSDFDQENDKPTELGMMNEPSTVENQEAKVISVEEVDNDNIPPIQTSAQEKVADQTKTEDDTILQKRPRREFEVNKTDIGKYGHELVAFFKARDTKKSAKTTLKEAQANYQKACADLTVMRDNFNAVFESSAEKDE